MMQSYTLPGMIYPLSAHLEIREVNANLQKCPKKLLEWWAAILLFV